MSPSTGSGFALAAVTFVQSLGVVPAEWNSALSLGIQFLVAIGLIFLKEHKGGTVPPPENK